MPGRGAEPHRRVAGQLRRAGPGRGRRPPAPLLRQRRLSQLAGARQSLLRRLLPVQRAGRILAFLPGLQPGPDRQAGRGRPADRGSHPPGQQRAGQRRACHRAQLPAPAARRGHHQQRRRSHPGRGRHAVLSGGSPWRRPRLPEAGAQPGAAHQSVQHRRRAGARRPQGLLLWRAGRVAPGRRHPSHLYARRRRRPHSRRPPADPGLVRPARQ